MIQAYASAVQPNRVERFEFTDSCVFNNDIPLRYNKRPLAILLESFVGFCSLVRITPASARTSCTAARALVCVCVARTADQNTMRDVMMLNAKQDIPNAAVAGQWPIPSGKPPHWKPRDRFSI